MEFFLTDTLKVNQKNLDLEKKIKDQGIKIDNLKSQLFDVKKELFTLIEACTLINSVLDVKKLIDLIMEMAKKVIDAEASSLMLIDENTGELIFEVAHGKVKDKIKTLRIPPGKGIAGWVAQTGKPLLIPDVSIDERFYSSLDESTKFVTHSILCVPLISKRKIIGIVEVINKNSKSGIKRNFSENDLTLLIALANQSAVALENAILYEKISKEKKRIETIVNSMSDPLIVTDEKLRVTLLNPAAKKLFPALKKNLNSDGEQNTIDFYHNQKLAIILNEVKNFFQNSNNNIVMMKPEEIILNSNVTIMKDEKGSLHGAILALRNITELKEKERKSIEFIAVTANNMETKQKILYKELKRLNIIVPEAEASDTSLEIKVNLLEIYLGILKLLYYTELESGPVRLDRTNVSMKSIIDNLIKTTEYGVNKRKVSLDIEILSKSESLVNIDKEQINHIMERLILNAAENSSNEKSIIKLSVLEKKYFFKIIVTDFGFTGSLPIEDDIQDNLNYRSFLDTPKLGRSPLENAFFKHIIDAHGGIFSFSKDDNDKYCYLLSLPKNWWA